jgi:protein SCO1/2
MSCRASHGFGWVRHGALLLAALATAAAAQAASEVAMPAQLRAATWTDSDGNPFQLMAVRAPLIVTTMAYTACKRVCSSTTTVLSELQAELDRAGMEAEFVIISFDPANDTPEQWREFRRKRGLTRANWHFIAGNALLTRRASRYLDLDFWEYHDHIVHDFRIVVFDQQWRSVARVDWETMNQLPRLLGIAPKSFAPAAIPVFAPITKK